MILQLIRTGTLPSLEPLRDAIVELGQAVGVPGDRLVAAAVSAGAGSASGGADSAGRDRRSGGVSDV